MSMRGWANRLIEDTDGSWEYVGGFNDKCKRYQCKRMRSLFKTVYPNGRIKYSDNNRTVMIELYSNTTWYSELVNSIVDELFPLTMPYMPDEEPYKVYFENVLTDPKNGDYDTIGVYYILKPDGEKHVINRYFKEGNGRYGWEEISQEEFDERRQMSHEIIK